MSSGGGGGQTTNTVQKADPWVGQQPYLTGAGGLFPEAQSLYNSTNLGFFPGQTYAPLSNETNAALRMQTNRALDGSPVQDAMNSELSKTLAGDYLDASKNPFLMPMADQIRAQVQPGLESKYAGAGAGRSSMAARGVSQGVTDALATQAYNNYNNERTNQLRAMMFAPTAINQDYVDAQKLQEVGGVREDLAQQQINEQMNRYTTNQMEPWQRLGLYNQMIQGNYGGTTNTSQVAPRRSLGSSIVSGGALGALGGYGLSNSLGLTTGQGIGYGGLAGGLLGGLTNGL